MTGKKSTTKGVKRKYYPFNHPDRLEVDGNKCVLIVRYEYNEEMYKKFPMIHDSHLCGYVAMPIKNIPAELTTLNIDSYLNFLNVPGGITYAEPVLTEEPLRQIAQDSLDRRLSNASAAREKRGSDMESFGEYMEEKIAAINQYHKDLVDLGAEVVVYGFDCGHAFHDDVKEYQDVKYIMKMCHQMERQLEALFYYYEELEESEPEDRAAKIDMIRGMAENLTDISPISLLAASGKFTKGKG